MYLVDRYLTLRCLAAITLVMLSLTGLTLLFALVEELGERQSSYSLADAIYYVLLTGPRRFDELLTYGVFLGVLLALGDLAEHGELTAMRAAGASATRLFMALVPTLIFWLVISISLSETIAPSSEEKAERQKLGAQFGEDALAQRGGLWFGDGGLYMQIKSIGSDGTLKDIVQYHVDDQNQLQRSIRAQAGIFDTQTETWTLRNGSLSVLSETDVQSTDFEQRLWKNPVTPAQLANQAFLEPRRMPLSRVLLQIRLLERQSLDATDYGLVFWNRLLKPLTFAGMALLALAIALGPLRDTGVGQRIAMGIFIGLGFKYLQDLFAPTAIVFGTPPWLAVGLPALIFIGTAILLIRRQA